MYYSQHIWLPLDFIQNKKYKQTGWEINLTYSMQKKAGRKLLSVYINYWSILALLDKAWSAISASVDVFTPRKEVINESNHWSGEEGDDGCFCSSCRKHVDNSVFLKQ